MTLYTYMCNIKPMLKLRLYCIGMIYYILTKIGKYIKYNVLWKLIKKLHRNNRKIDNNNTFWCFYQNYCKITVEISNLQRTSI